MVAMSAIGNFRQLAFLHRRKRGTASRLNCDQCRPDFSHINRNIPDKGNASDSYKYRETDYCMQQNSTCNYCPELRFCP